MIARAVERHEGFHDQAAAAGTAGRPILAVQMMELPKIVLLTGVGKSSKQFAGFRGVWNFETIMQRGNHEPGNLLDGEVTGKVAERHPFVASEA